MNQALTFHRISKAVSLVTLVALLILWPSYASAQTTSLYVSPDGNDSWTGTAAARSGNSVRGPFATIQRAKDEVRTLKQRTGSDSAVTVYLRGGVHQLAETVEFTTADSGSPGKPVIYANYPGEKPVISGGRNITGWQYYRDGIWFAQVPSVISEEWSFDQLFVNGSRRTRARTPDGGFHEIAELLHSTNFWQGTNQFRFHAGDIQSTWKNLQDAEIVVLHHWVDVRLPIAKVDDASRIVTFQKSSHFNLIEQGNTAARYFVENVFEALDSPGEWYLDRSTGIVYYMPFPDENLMTARVVAPRLDYLFLVNGEPGSLVRHLDFRGLTFSHNQWTLPANEAGDFLAVAQIPAAMSIWGGENISVEGCNFEALGTYGVEIQWASRNNRVLDNRFFDLGGGGIRLAGASSPDDSANWTVGNLVVGNRLSHLGEVFRSARGIFLMRSSGNRIANNEISELRYNGISVGWFWGYGDSGTRDNVIEFNHIHDIGQMPDALSDLGGIYMQSEMPGTIVRNNLIHDIAASMNLGFGIYLDEASSHITVENNVVHSTQDAGFFQHFGRDNSVSNNIFAFGGTSQIHLGKAKDSEGLRFERNIVLWDGVAPLLLGGVTAGHFSTDRNTYFRTDGKEILFGKETLAKWRQRGHDIESVIADPMVELTDAGLVIDPSSPAITLGFQAIDLGSVGPSIREDEGDLTLASRRRATRPGSPNTTGSGN